MRIWHIWRVCEPTETHFGCLNCLKYRIYTPLTALCPGPAPTHAWYGPRKKKKDAESYFFRRTDLQSQSSLKSHDHDRQVLSTASFTKPISASPGRWASGFCGHLCCFSAVSINSRSLFFLREGIGGRDRPKTKGPSKTKATGLDVYLIKFRGTDQPHIFFPWVFCSTFQYVFRRFSVRGVQKHHKNIFAKSPCRKRFPKKSACRVFGCFSAM
jgi:hypothetical protein